MTIKYAYINNDTREYMYANSKEELKEALATQAAKVYSSHYCNGEPYTIVEVLEDGSEKWYTPTGEQRLTATEIEAQIKQMDSFANAGEIPVAMLGG